ncbi:MAG TPA: YkoF family thiamine/hydroxymethylpyrimidine-binding protein [Saprospiraceae bacterium]|nr:YkoF family thiamine/hydroxymethylpyrimidine-binding protein [Saprospiraceae bacterium]
MQIIVEISLYPFTKDYDTTILNFVQKLRDYKDIDVTPSETATVVRGEYNAVFAMLEQECKAALSGNARTALVIKILNTL